SYKDQTITDIFTPEQLKNAIKLDANEFSTSILINDGRGKFTLKHLPVEAQLSPVYGIEVGDFDGDEHVDIFLGGNLFNAKPEVGRYDASYGLLLKGDGKSNFVAISPIQSGIELEGEVRDIVTLRTADGEIIMVSRNNDSIISLKKNKK
ncbi:MAG: hypothetical protein C0490_16725, partial [Marivirga sp.]|nr:hypothetical protein [Marivirga sp.]